MQLSHSIEWQPHRFRYTRRFYPPLEIRRGSRMKSRRLMCKGKSIPEAIIARPLSLSLFSLGTCVKWSSKEKWSPLNGPPLRLHSITLREFRKQGMAMRGMQILHRWNCTELLAGKWNVSFILKKKVPGFYFSLSFSLSRGRIEHIKSFELLRN